MKHRQPHGADGRFLPGASPIEDGVRFWRAIKPDEKGCWLWQAGLSGNGYATFHLRDKSTVNGHRWAYEYLRGPIPPDLELDHLCRVPACVNPRHLEAVTHQENMRRGWWAQKTHCKRGHLLSGDNLYASMLPVRFCKLCHHIRQNEYARLRRERADGWHGEP